MSDEVWPAVGHLRDLLDKTRHLLLAGEDLCGEQRAGSGMDRLRQALDEAWPAYERFADPMDRSLKRLAARALRSGGIRLEVGTLPGDVSPIEIQRYLETVADRIATQLEREAARPGEIAGADA